MKVPQNPLLQLPADGPELVEDGDGVGHEPGVVRVEPVGLHGDDEGLIGGLVGLDAPGEGVGVEDVA